MNILMLGRWLTPPRYPLKLTREYQFGHHLGQKHRLTLAFTTDRPNAIGPISTLRAEFGELEFATVPRAWKALLSALRLATGESCTLSYSRSEALQTRLADRLKSTPFGVVFVTSSSMIPYALNTDPAIPLVVDFADLDSQWWIHQAERSPFPGTRFFRTEATRLRAAESLAARRAAHCLVASAEAADIVTSFQPSGPVTIVKSGVDVNVPATGGGRAEPPTIVLNTSLGGKRDANDAFEFYRRVMSLLRPRVPEVRLVVASHEAPVSSDLTGTRSRLDVRAPRPDVRPILQRATLAVAPLWSGTEVRHSVLLPMAAGLPLVATSRAARAVGAEVDRDLLVADQPEDFAEKILQLLQNPGLRAELGERGRSFVSMQYAWSVVTANLNEIVESVVKAGTSEATKPEAALPA